MAVLTRKLIKELVEAGKLKIEPFDSQSLQPASYDLGIGRRVLLGPIPGETLGKIVDLEREPGKKIGIKVGQFAAVLTREFLSLPCNICARFGVKSKLARKGLIVFGGLQVDPGWRGYLSVFLLNIGPEEIPLTLEEPAFSIEFHRLEGETEPYEGEYQNQTDFPAEQINYILTARTAGLAEVSILRERLSKIEKEIEMRKEMEVEALERKSLELLNELELKNPKLEEELYSKLSEWYLQKAKDFYNKKDFLQASEKGWGAAAEAVKACAARRGKRLVEHRALEKFVSELVKETDDKEIQFLWSAGRSLHDNFYESALTPFQIGICLEGVEIFIEKLRKL